MDYEQFFYQPVLGYSGCGKSEVMTQLRDSGCQVVSVEEVAGVQGVCLAHAFEQSLIEQAEFDARLEALFASFDTERDVWIEWKGDHVTGLRLPPSLCDAVRRHGAYFIDVPLERRVDRLLAQYPDWTIALDLIAGSLARLPSMTAATAARLRALADAGDARAFFRATLTLHFDPLYEREIGRFAFLMKGRLIPTPGGEPGFAGSIVRKSGRMNDEFFNAVTLQLKESVCQ